MVEAVTRDFPDAEDDVLHRAVHTLLNQRLLEVGFRIQDFIEGLDICDIPQGTLMRRQMAMFDTTQTRETAERQKGLLNDAQQEAFRTIIESVQNYNVEHARPVSLVFFIDGPGGSGKTFLYTTLLAEVRAVMKYHCIAVASSGIAALLLPGGSTAHSKFRIPLNCDSDSVCAIPHQSELAFEIKATRLIIFDESPMISKNVFEAMDRTFRFIMKQVNPALEHVAFGGIPIVLGGDFRQVLPVVRGAGSAQTISASVNRSYLWNDIRALRLQSNLRLQTDVHSDWSSFRLSVGEGRVEKPVTLPDSTVLCRDIEDLITNVFGENIELDMTSTSAILCTTLADVTTINAKVLRRMEGEAKTYFSADHVVEDQNTTDEICPAEFLNSLQPSGMPPHSLTIKEGCIIICLRNLDRHNGLCNGTRLRVTGLGERLIRATIITEGSFLNRECLIPKVPITPSDTRLPFKWTRVQFTILPAFAMTVNKSQGQSLSRIGIYSPRSLFTHGQLYVMLSRTRTGPAGIYVIDRQINNVVYKDVLLC
jgi:ATP-dependent DNA helicase PIF1